MSNLFPRTRSLIQKLTDWINSDSGLSKRVGRIAEWYHNKMGYRKYGLFADDLITEEHNVVKEALTRLTEREMADRVFRQRRAMQLNMNHELLPESEWVKPNQDIPYLYRHILDVCKERDEKDLFDKLKPPR